jgi:hypothetical protein
LRGIQQKIALGSKRIPNPDELRESNIKIFKKNGADPSFPFKSADAQRTINTEMPNYSHPQRSDKIVRIYNHPNLQSDQTIFISKNFVKSYLVT